MADQPDGLAATRLKREIAQLRAELQSVREKTADQVRNELQEKMASLEQDAAASRERVRQIQRENASMFGILHSRSLAGPEQMVVKPFWSTAAVQIDANAAILLMPFKKSWADDVCATVKRALESLGVTCLRADDLGGPVIMEDIWNRICECSIVIADLTDSNPNVTYEVGLADVVGQPAILMCQTTDPTTLPFDFLGRRLIKYSTDRLDVLESRLVERVRTHRNAAGLKR